MPYWMKNEEHGLMPVYDLSEKARVENLGWRLLNEGESPELERPTDPAEVQAEEIKRKPGRPKKV